MRHRRAVIALGSERWLVVDRLTSDARHQYRLHWLLADCPFRLQPDATAISLTTPSGEYHVQVISDSSTLRHDLVRGDPHSVRGWHSLYYYHREPALSWAFTATSHCAWFLTTFTPEPCTARFSENAILIQSDQWQSSIALNSSRESDSLISGVMTGVPLRNVLFLSE